MVVERATASRLWTEMVEKLKLDTNEQLKMLSQIAEGEDWAFVEALVTEIIVCHLGEPLLA